MKITLKKKPLITVMYKQITSKEQSKMIFKHLAGSELHASSAEYFKYGINKCRRVLPTCLTEKIEMTYTLIVLKK